LDESGRHRRGRLRNSAGALKFHMNVGPHVLAARWKPSSPKDSLELESYIERISEALEHALNYDAVRLNSDVLNTPSGAFYPVKVGFEISEECMRLFRQLAFESYLKTRGEIDEAPCARNARIEIEKC
jgi:hypothetical protein